MIERRPCVYILASNERGTLYVGVTSDVIKRVWEHKSDVVDGFARKYHVHNLVWFEQHDTMEYAISREKAIKEWKRAWKFELIEGSNPRSASRRSSTRHMFANPKKPCHSGAIVGSIDDGTRNRFAGFTGRDTDSGFCPQTARAAPE